ncbi:hypothetical protein EON65_26205 [archaeon]|nr:MAG: hypothetical protein EON65_26205 [archaeon]
MIVVGPSDHGKSSFSQILTAYALRLDRTPIYVDLDVGQSPFSIPGSMVALPLEKACLSVEVSTIYGILMYMIYMHIW